MRIIELRTQIHYEIAYWSWGSIMIIRKYLALSKTIDQDKYSRNYGVLYSLELLYQSAS